MTVDDAMLHGSQFTRDHLTVIEVAYGAKAAMAYAASMAVGARNWIADKHGSRAAFELMVGLGDDLLTNVLTKENGDQRS